MRSLVLLLVVGSLTALRASDRLVLPGLEADLGASRYPLVTSLIVSQDGHIVFEKYYGSGGPDHLNNTRSATKSLTALAIGRAIADGKIPSVDSPILPFFPDLSIRGRDEPQKIDLRLKDLLTMSSALAADDSDRTSPGNEDRMHEHDSWTAWGLNLPTKPGYRRDSAGYGPFTYATINAVLAGQLLQRATGQPVDEYLIETLFAPLGITQFKFQKSPIGEVMTGGGIELRAIDLWRIGELVRGGGKWEGRQVLPAEWVRECLTVRHAETGQSGIGYGYLFWHREFSLGERKESAWFMAGNGGNLVVVIPGVRAVVVITRTAFNNRAAAATSARMVSDYILPELVERVERR